ncbi:hypothetical protein PHLGIDRAFT_510248 [Phlebiopsis gigantea 11061_1 CR5-6]|uniref:DNA polymerase n=1 Tax=Phlebiopsis gigantea (strain 11061_1 CR5-6) TaxID=745531 RepID=A0A0C3S6P1_PHLG1|nr:hypothetical protein PHLGIDRAFT_510248 [Phlebiopsis gigantea 11061_1 CR5-6]
MTIDEPNLRVRINQIDYTVEPAGPLDNTTLPKVPIIRIYGESSIGKKTCLHVHQVYPYFFVEYPGNMSPDSVNLYIARLRHSLNHAIALSLKRNPNSVNSQFVRAVILVKGVHFYGFHASYSPFLKVHIADPALVNRAVTLIRSGTVMKTRFLVYESHLNFVLQFLSDFGLYGCGWIDLAEVWERGRDEDEEASLAFSAHASPYYRQTRMALELDVAAHHILSRHHLSPRNHNHKLTIPAPPLPDEPVVLSVRELWEDERRRRAERGLSPSPPRPKDLSERLRGSGGEWSAEARWWDELGKRIEAERALIVGSKDGERSWERWVMTTFQSVEALWEDEWRTWKPSHRDAEENPYEVPAIGRSSQPQNLQFADTGLDVDENLLSSQELSILIEHEEQEWIRRQDELAQDERNAEAERVAEEGPPPEDEYGLGTPVKNRDPTKRYVVPGSLFGLEPRQEEVDPQLPCGTSSDEFFLDLPETPKRKRRKIVIEEPVSPRLPSSQFTTIKGTPFTRLNERILQSTRAYVYRYPPPTTIGLLSSLDTYGVSSTVYRDPYYSNEEDAPEHSREYAGLLYTLKGGTGVGVLDDWVGHERPNVHGVHPDNSGIYGWEYAATPPSVKQSRLWLAQTPREGAACARTSTSQILGPTPARPNTAKPTPPGRIIARDKGGMTALCLEVFAPSPTPKLPDPGFNEIIAIFYALYDSNFPRVDHSTPFRCETGMIIVENAQLDARRTRDWSFETVSGELDLINRIIDVVQELNPDIIAGWDVQIASWGYLSARADTYGLDLGEQISRAPGRARANQTDQWGERTTSTFKVIGRHVLNLWRIFRTELSLTSYSFENAVYHVLRRRTPRYSPATIFAWYHSSVPEHTSRLLDYYMSRTYMVAEMVEVAEVITKNSEFARVFGVDFFSVISRGSQFKVESFMFRIAKPESYVLLSPSRDDVGKQNAAECMPLIMEPLSAFYSSPLVVLDFQSLYPSVMIAYNYCYSTCLGRVVNFKGQNKFGVTDLKLPPGILDTLKDYIQISPNGMVFVKSVVRKGLLGRMLTELLDTRVMVKQAMKGVKDDKALYRVLEARQLSLKFIANVTYGYTSATFSGRMPAVEIADAIVQTGRETLEKAIRLIDATPKWGAKVVYGDTDSLFIYMRGKTKEQAFRIGHDIADTVSAMNPAPIKLKFEKVYLPCVLMAKKRYVGFKYENPDDQEPVFDAKGIETVRRDGVPAQQKMTETSLKILFRTQDLSEVKDYCCTTWAQVLENRVSLQDFIFAKEVRLGTYSNDVPPPPGVAVATRRMVDDPNDEPQYGDRIPYVISRGGPGMRLVDRAVPPEIVLNSSHKRIDATYYISKVLIPPLERIFNLVGADVRSWFDEMPRATLADEPNSLLLTPRKKARQAELISRFKIDEHFLSSRCLTCGSLTEEESVLCEVCCYRPQETIGALFARVHRTEHRLQNVHGICVSCSGIPSTEPVRCESLDCPWLYERKKLENKAENLNAVQDLVEELVQFHEDDSERSDDSPEVYCTSLPKLC